MNNLLQTKWEINHSEIHGFGAFTTKFIRKGECIGLAYQLMGKVNGKYIAGKITKLGALHNHSLSPTAIPKIIEGREIRFYALKKLKKSTEITCNYNEYTNVMNIERPEKSWK